MNRLSAAVGIAICIVALLIAGMVIWRTQTSGRTNSGADTEGAKKAREMMQEHFKPSRGGTGR